MDFMMLTIGVIFELNFSWRGYILEMNAPTNQINSKKTDNNLHPTYVIDHLWFKEVSRFPHVKSAVAIPSKHFKVEESIRDKCSIPYLRHDGTSQPCGGLLEKRSGCPPYSHSASATRELLTKSQYVLLVMGDGLTSFDEQAEFHKGLLRIERALEKENISIIEGFACGPCRICKECLGNGDCNNTKARRYALESCGIDVEHITNLIAEKTGQKFWRLDWISNFGETEDSGILLKKHPFKSIIAIAIDGLPSNIPTIKTVSTHS